ncbi:MAG: hypothetical protein O3A47_02885 [Chloroflexi bacterium]|nr:hypothetical protein [Chloroflexota bacterium]
MYYTAVTATGVLLLLTACGSDGASEVTPVHALKAEACTVGEARDTVLHIRNLDDFEWAEVTVDLVKSDVVYQGKFDNIRPETERPSEAITDPTRFSVDDSPGSTRLNPIGNRLAWRAVLGNFANLESSKIAIATPFAAEWTGEVHTCQ